MRCIQFFVTCLLLPAALFASEASAPNVPRPIPDEVYLQDVIDFALENSLAVLQAQERIEEQYGLIAEVKSNVLPNLALISSISEQDESLAGPFATKDSWSVSLQVRQPIYGGGALNAAIRAQKAVEQAALYELQAAVEAVIQDVKIRYYDVLLQRDRIAVEEQNIELFEEQLTSTKSRFDAGAVSNFDVLQAEVSLANAKPALIRARNNFRVAVAELKRSIGYVKERDHVTTMPSFMGELAVELRDYDLLQSIVVALDKRPELAQQSLLIDAAEEGIDIAKAGYRPTLDFVGSYGYRRSYEFLDDRFDNPEGGWFLGLESTWNLWDGRATKGRVMQAKSQVRQAELSLSESRLAIELEVRSAISELQGAAELVEAARQVTGQAEEALRLANERYNVGSSTFLDTLQARVALTEARNNELQANYSYLVSRVNVERAIGETPYDFVGEAE